MYLTKFWQCTKIFEIETFHYKFSVFKIFFIFIKTCDLNNLDMIVSGAILFKAIIFRDKRLYTQAQ